MAFPRLSGLMIRHTMFVSFDDPISDPELNQFLADIETATRDTGIVEAFSSQRHIPVSGEGEIPALVATAILQFDVADLNALEALFAASGTRAVIHKWQSRIPYRVAWGNHEPLR
ncbi:hypothetical protein [Mycolicibacterium porcinum]|uniref:YCII-related domain-containing protein n=1 Tax=Mycolicibacterium porcinum TaxID=39693 RepID=A0ABV3VDH8_9MYCO